MPARGLRWAALAALLLLAGARDGVAWEIGSAPARWSRRGCPLPLSSPPPPPLPSWLRISPPSNFPLQATFPSPSPLPPLPHRAAVAFASAAGASARCQEDAEDAAEPRCQRCAPDGSKCLECWPGNGLSSGGECVACNVTSEHGDRCVRCDGDDPSFCTACQPRFGMGGATGKCWVVFWMWTACQAQ